MKWSHRSRRIIMRIFFPYSNYSRIVCHGSLHSLAMMVPFYLLVFLQRSPRFSLCLTQTKVDDHLHKYSEVNVFTVRNEHKVFPTCNRPNWCQAYRKTVCKKKRRVISKYLLSEECVLSLWLWLWDWERRQKQFESILLQNWPCLDAHYAFFHRGNHSCACNARCSISQPLIPDWCSFCTSQNFDLFSSLFFFSSFSSLREGNYELWMDC